MKIQVPFYKQESRNDCGPTALKMILEYFGKLYSLKELSNLVDSDKSGITWTLDLAKVVAGLGFNVEFYSTHLGFNPENYNLEFYKKETDGISSNKQKLERLIVEARNVGVKIEEKSLSLEELLSKISKNSIPLILLDWSKIKGTQEFTGHFAPIVGYDNENIYVHNSGANNTCAFMPIKRDIFEEARKSKGTDEEVIIISR